MSTLAAKAMSNVAPCATHTEGVLSDKSREEVVARSVVCICFGGEYDAGASWAVIVIVPALSAVTRVETSPLSSLNTVQVVAFPQAENPAAGTADRTTLAPLIGVTPLASSTCTRIGFCASPPRGVDGLLPARSRMMSVGPAP